MLSQKAGWIFFKHFRNAVRIVICFLQHTQWSPSLSAARMRHSHFYTTERHVRHTPRHISTDTKLRIINAYSVPNMIAALRAPLNTMQLQGMGH